MSKQRRIDNLRAWAAFCMKCSEPGYATTKAESIAAKMNAQRYLDRAAKLEAKLLSKQPVKPKS